MNGKLVIPALISVIIAIAIGYGIGYSQFQTHILNLQTGETTILTMLSGSMCTLPGSRCDGWSHPFVPTLHVGDLIIVQEVNIEEIIAAPYPDGDIIVFHRLSPSGELIVHRAISKEERNGTWYFQTKGDGNAGPDSPTPNIPEDNVVGKVIAASRKYEAGTWNNLTYNVNILTNSVLAYLNFSEPHKQVSFGIAGYISQVDKGICNATIPKNLLRCDSLTDWKVLLDGDNIVYTINQNETHTFIYFTYDQNVQNVQIIGTKAITELPSPVWETWLAVLSQWWFWSIISFIAIAVLASLLGLFYYKYKKEKEAIHLRKLSVWRYMRGESSFMGSHCQFIPVLDN